MTQQPYYPPQYPQAPAPQQTYPAQQPPYAQPMPQGYPPQQPQQYAPQAYPPAQYAPQQAPPQQPLAQGGLDEFYSQPSSATGPGISWSDPQKNQRPVGTTFVGVVVRDVSHGDVQQQTNPQGVPQTFRDGRPKFQMKVPLKGVAMFGPDNQQLPIAEMPEGEATWYVRGQARDELTRAMAEAGVDGAPKGGAVVAITLTNRRPNGGGMQPSNIVAIRYMPADGAGGTPSPAPSVTPAAPGPEAASPASAPVQQPPAPQPPAQPSYPPVTAEQAPPAQYPQQGPPVPQGYGQPPAPAQYAPPAGQAPQAPPVPQGMSPEQQALFAKITGQGPTA